MELLKTRLSQLETVESKLVSSRTEIKHLQQQLRIYRQDAHFADGVQDKLMRCEQLEHQVQLLSKENTSLRQDRTNADLLRYQVQSLQHHCSELERRMEDGARLHLENNELKTSDGKEHDSVLRVQLSELQQREIVTLHKYGGLTTQ